MKASAPVEVSKALVGAVASRDEAASLDALMDFLALQLIGAKPYESARIVGQIMAAMKRKAELPKPEQKKTVADDLAAARKRRRAEAKAAALAAGESN